MGDKATRVNFQRSGGFGGVTLSKDIDTSELAEDEAAELEQLLDRVDFTADPAPQPRGGGADRFQYDLTVERGGERYQLTCGEAQLTPELKELVDRLQAMARRR
ncbi:MAG: protealysin inhibitor emfourin [Acidimicrobiales bacterium]